MCPIHVGLGVAKFPRDSIAETGHQRLRRRPAQAVTAPRVGSPTQSPNDAGTRTDTGATATASRSPTNDSLSPRPPKAPQGSEPPSPPDAHLPPAATTQCARDTAFQKLRDHDFPTLFYKSSPGAGSNPTLGGRSNPPHFGRNAGSRRHLLHHRRSEEIGARGASWPSPWSRYLLR